MSDERSLDWLFARVKDSAGIAMSSFKKDEMDLPADEYERARTVSGEKAMPDMMAEWRKPIG